MSTTPIHEDPAKVRDTAAKKPPAKTRLSRPVELSSTKPARPTVSRASASPDEHRQLLHRWADPRFAEQKASYLKELQTTYGNRYVQRLQEGSGQTTSPERAASQSVGNPLDKSVRQDMEQRFGTSLGGARVHTDSAAADAARGFGAQAFTTGKDVYFARDKYQPSTRDGKKLLAHELTHTLQQKGQESPARHYALEIVPADDPSEVQAHRAANEAVNDGSVSAGTLSSLVSHAGDASKSGRLYREAVPGAAGQVKKPAVTSGPNETGDFVIGLGPGLKIRKEDVDAAKKKGRFEKDISSVALPGVKPKHLVIKLKEGALDGGYVTADLSMPYVRTEGGPAKLEFDKDGKVSFTGKARVDIPALNNPVINISLEEGEFSADVTLEASNLAPKSLPKLKVLSATVTLGIEKNRLKGGGQVALEYQGLAKGDFTVDFQEGQPSGKGRVDLTPDYLKGAAVELQLEKGNLQGNVDLPATKLAPPIPGFTITAGTLSLGYKDAALSGAGTDIAFDYRGLGNGTVSFSIAKDHLQGKGSLSLTIPGMTPISGTLDYKNGKLSGSATITADKFPKGLPIRGGTITVIVDDRGQISGRGSVGIHLFQVGEGELTLSYDKGVLDLTAEVELKKIPGLEAGRVKIGLKEGKLEGEGEIAIAAKQIPGLSGAMLVIYKDDHFSGKAKVGYAKDKLSGQAELVLIQDEKSKLSISGSGDITARLTDWLTGKVHLEVMPDATTKIAGQLKADDIELFPEKRADKELFKISKNIPLWAILVAVIRLSGGVRAGVGPGRLRGVTAEGDFTTEPGVEPTFSIHGELYIPAFAEAYIVFGAGLGLDVVLGSLTGGIEAVGTAGIYGAVSVIPEISYDGKNYAIDGTATLAAAAKLKLGLQAWAEIEALWITVWSNEWKLAEWMWDVGPELALQANMHYVFGRPEPPTLDFKTSDIDSSKLIQDAMPKDGPKGSGARDALKNTAQWKGQLKEQGKNADKVPPELAQKQQKAAPAPSAPPKPSKPKPPAGMKPKDEGKVKEDSAKDMKDKGAADTSKPLDKDVQERWQKGLAALEQLRAKSETNPEDSEEITKDLAAIKNTYGFKELSFVGQGDEWEVTAVMNPSKKQKIKKDPMEELRKQIEGKVGTYSELKAMGKTGDQITPDHEPQHALMSHVKDDVKFKGNRLFAGTDFDSYSHGEGVSMNIDFERHTKTRTYGGGGSSSKAESANAIQSKLDNLPDTATRKDARQEVAVVVRKALKDDRDVIKKDIYENATGLNSTVKNRAINAAEQVKKQNNDKYFKAFNDPS